MKLSRFIFDNQASILDEWDAFAKTMKPAALTMSTRALRDHASQILEAIAFDIDTPQSGSEERSKSNSEDDVLAASAASLHGTLREYSGFTLVQLTSEFRALRASVLRLWLDSITHYDKAVAGDIMRFNEAVDQALAESAVTFSDENNKTRDTFLAILGHDLRTPISAISYSGELLQKLAADDSQLAAIGKRLERSSKTMGSMVNDLLEYSRTQIGGRIPITKAPCDLLDAYTAAHSDASNAYPSCTFEDTNSGAFDGMFDSVRIQQVIMNLLTNACQYHRKGTAIVTRMEGNDGEVTCAVNNQGPMIPEESLGAIFSALVRLPQEGKADTKSTSLGLGLFIAKQIVEEHKGVISVTSNETEGTTFKFRIPKT